MTDGKLYGSQAVKELLTERDTLRQQLAKCEESKRQTVEMHQRGGDRLADMLRETEQQLAERDARIKELVDTSSGLIVDLTMPREERIAELEQQLAVSERDRAEWKHTADLLKLESDDFVADRDERISQLEAAITEAQADNARHRRWNVDTELTNNSLAETTKRLEAALRQCYDAAVACFNSDAELVKGSIAHNLINRIAYLCQQALAGPEGEKVT